jgi:poly(3-hydroxybutyrate) depolymerase
MENTALYSLYELQHATLAPLRMYANAARTMHTNPFSPLAYTSMGRTAAASLELLERITRRYAKPAFGLKSTTIDGKKVAVKDEVILDETFCQLRHFKRDVKGRNDPKVLIVAPMSGHHATLLRGTVEGLLPHAEVYITDWVDAKEVPLFCGKFDLDDYITMVWDFIRFLGKGVNLIAVCQPAVPVLCAVSLMHSYEDPFVPKTMTLMGGPIDPRKAPTKVNALATEQPLEWFERTVITRVPWNYPGYWRRVYPGFLQLSGFMTMNLERHIGEHVKLFQHLVQGDGDSAAAHRKFYNEYLSVADLPAEFYLQTIDRVFQRHLLPKGEFIYRDRDPVQPEKITQTALLAVEGERDDISGVGQTKASIALCKGLKDDQKHYHLQKGVGHYGIFNGRNYRTKILPVIMEHIHKHR